MKPVYFTLFVICGVFITFAYSQEKNVDKQQFIQNIEPKYAGSEFVTLEELYKIPVDEYEQYYFSDIWAMDVDSDTNLYVLDNQECTVTVFDKNGKFLRTMGGAGQGPGELEEPGSLCILDGKIYIYEWFKGIKVWDLQGNYVDFFIKDSSDFVVFRAFDDFLLTVEGNSINESLSETEYYFERYTLDLEKINTVARLEHKEKNGTFVPDLAFAVNSKRHIYFLTGRDEYKINIYSADGDILKSFGREYKRIPYSRLLHEYKRKIRAEVRSEYPQVVRIILIDDCDYVWVVLGECTMDCDASYSVLSTIDIFNEDGEFLYTFECPHFVAWSFIKCGRLYSRPTGDDPNIRVFKIHYNIK
ncbi:hypothetical protein AMJ80_06985 [bacterium SM23_31]|nr:MAG: hypothetical protein AMJ80_06985 [bacterium SM23_31]